MATNTAPKCYISGPISGLTEKEYQSNFDKGVHKGRLLGFETLNPLDVEAACFQGTGDDGLPVPTCGSDKTFDDGTYQHTWKCYLKHDLIAMLDCQAILMLPNWFNSQGAILEREVAIRMGFEVMHLEDDYVTVIEHKEGYNDLPPA